MVLLLRWNNFPCLFMFRAVTANVPVVARDGVLTCAAILKLWKEEPEEKCKEPFCAEAIAEHCDSELLAKYIQAEAEHSLRVEVSEIEVRFILHLFRLLLIPFALSLLLNHAATATQKNASKELCNDFRLLFGDHVRTAFPNVPVIV